jgi:lysophospholipase L1-like esterase
MPSPALRVLMLLALLASPLPAAAEAASPCSAAPAVWGGFPALPRVATALAGKNLRVVAVGSSSTWGAGASTRDRAYPAQLERMLQERFPGATIEVLNRGVGGETVAANLARFQRDVLALQPDLVIWQVGTNDALRGVPATLVRAGLLDGIRRVRATGADLVLLDPQPLFAPEQEAAVQRIRAVLVDVAQATKVPLLPRHELMLFWLTSGAFTRDALLGPDGLHMTDASYRCLAVRLADLFPAAGIATPDAAPSPARTRGDRLREAAPPVETIPVSAPGAGR